MTASPSARLVGALATLAALVASACEPARTPVDAGGAAPAPAPAELITLVESAPLETSLDHADVADTAATWIAMIQGARATIDASHFYASDAPGSRLAGVIGALEAAARRGVRVRFLADALFAKTYPATLARLDAAASLEVREIDFAPGVQHAKYLLVDARDAFVGSANFDWRSLTHIHEIGARVRDAGVGADLADVFERDWARAVAKNPEPTRAVSARGPTRRADPAALVQLVVSPPDQVANVRAELPEIVRAIDQARSHVRVQVLQFRDRERDGAPFTTLDAALRRAAARDVQVELAVSDWAIRKPRDAETLRSLAEQRNVAIRVVTIPPFSGGPVPFARVAHAKYMTVDDRLAWLGSSNWEGDYFTKSRNVGLVVRARPFVAALDRVFRDVWFGPYTKPLASASPAPGPPR